MDDNNVVDVKEIAGGDRISSSNDVSNDLVDTVSSNKNTTLTIRQQCGKQLSNITDIVNDNLIVVRYATFSTVLLLGAYGIANIPLFYRHKHVLDIPISSFTKRKYLHGRIVGIAETRQGIARRSSSSSSSPSLNNRVASLLSSSLQRDKISSTGNSSRESNNASDLDTQQIVQQHPIVLLFRHSSPMERLLSKSAMERLLKFTGQSKLTGLLYTSANPHRNLLPIELAGLIVPPFTQSPSILSSSLTGSSSSNTFPLIDELIQQKTKVSIQLLAQRVAAEPKRNNKKEEGDRQDMDEDRIQNTAICHLLYKQPKQYFWQTSNAGLEMILKGEAWTSGVVVPLSNLEDDKGSSKNKPKANESTIIDYHPTVKQLQDDTKYISQLEEAEYKAWQTKIGMWSSKHTREIRKEYIEYEEEEKNKWSVLSLLKRGFDFVRRR